MAEYPEWLLPYKEKGTYVSKRKNGYALYRGHSERVPGKKNPVLKCDEYLGIVTERDGLIPSSPPVRPGVEVYRYGVWYLCEECCGSLRVPLERDGLDGEYLFARAVLELEGSGVPCGYSGSWLSVAHPGVDAGRPASPEEERRLGRLRLQVSSKLSSRFGGPADDVLASARDVYAVHVNGRWTLSRMPERMLPALEAAGIEMRLDMKGGGPKK
jgi:hypothetical protein